MKTVGIMMITGLISAIAMGSPSQYGPISSGGGMVVACEQDGQTSYQVLDYYEAMKTFGKAEVMSSTGDWVEDYKRLVTHTYYLQGTRHDHDEMSERNLRNFFKAVEWVDSSELPFQNDQGPTVVLPEGCTLRQAAITFDGRSHFRIAKDIWEGLDTLNKATLVMHEIWYSYLRTLSDLDSIHARRSIQLILSAPHRQPVTAGRADAKLQCFGMSGRSGNVPYAFYVEDTNSGGSRFLFTHIAGRPLLALTVANSSTDFAVKPLPPNLETPVDPSANTVELISLHSEHLVGAWELKLRFQGGEAVTVQAYRNGAPQGDEAKVSCMDL